MRLFPFHVMTSTQQLILGLRQPAAAIPKPACWRFSAAGCGRYSGSRLSHSTFILLLLTSLVAHAEPRTSASYTAPATVTNASGSRATTLSYTNDSSLGGFGGIATAAAPAQTLKTGYIGQLHDATALQLSAATPTLAEGSTDQLAATQHFDDDTTFTPPASSITWSVQSGPLASISPGGLATAAAVYQNTAATAHGSYGGLSSTLDLTVLETIADNFSPYAGDRVNDAWQVQYYGLVSPGNTGPADDSDADGLSNLIEFAFGTIPTSNSSGTPALQYGGTFAGGGIITATGQPVVAFEPVSTGLDFRAVFIRRKSHLADGLLYTPQFSANLTTWQSSSVTPVILADDGIHQVVTVPYPPLVGGRKARFFRVSISLTP